jgi:hypothetical protein
MDFAVDLNLNSSFLDVLFFGGARPTCVFRLSASDIPEGQKSVGFEKSAEGTSRTLAESRQFQNGRLVGTCHIHFSEVHSTDNQKNAAKSLGFGVSGVERISTRWSESVGALRETELDMMMTLTFPWDSHFPSRDEANVLGSTAVWIGAGISLAAILMAIVVISGVLGCRPWLWKGATDATESDMETDIPDDWDVSSTAVDPYVSEENALSTDRIIPGEWAEDFSEGAVGASAR